MEQLGAKVIRHFGTELWKLRQSLSSFMQQKQRSIHQIDKQMASLCSSHQMSITKDSSSQSTQKESQSALSQPEESFFFYPDQPTLRTIEELIRERPQLPIRVFLDSSGRLKYW